MTLVRDGVASDELVGLHQAYANTMALQMRPETPILSMVSPNLKNLRTADGMVPYGQRAYKYKEKQHLAARTTLNGGIAAGVTTVVLTDKVCRPSDIVICGDEAIELGTSDDYLTFSDCTRSKFTGADAAHSDGDNVFVFGTSYEESSNSPTAGPVKQATEVTTDTDIFLESVKVSGSARYMQQYAEGNMDKIVQYTLEAAVSLKKQLQYRIMWSDYQASSGEDTAGRFDGAYERIAGTNYVDFGSDNISYPDVQQMVRKCTRKGATGPFMLAVSDYQHDQIDQWAQPYGRLEASELAQAIFGSHVFALRVQGKVIDIISTDEMDVNALLCSYQLVGVGPKSADRVFHPEAIGKKGDYDEVMVVGEYTCEWPLPYAHCWGKSVKYE